MVGNSIGIIKFPNKNTPNATSTNSGSSRNPFIIEPDDIVDIIKLANPAIIMMDIMEKS